MTEEQRALWIMSAPITAEYNKAMQKLNSLSYTTCEQHKDLSKARLKRDNMDLEKLKTKLTSYSPFSEDPSLRNIITGVVANPNVNVVEFESVGRSITEAMIGQCTFTYSFKRKNKAVTLGDESAITVASDRSINPALLFQRLLVVAKTDDLSLENVLDFELSPYPPALFEATNVLRKPNKPQLAHAISDYMISEAQTECNHRNEHYVLDGGSLLHRIPWTKGDSYGEIAESYADFTIRHYGLATVVFDGYTRGPSIKDNTHERRTRHKVCPIVNFTAETKFVGKKEDFLSRPTNKQNIIDMISVKMQKKGCHVINSLGDADADIAKVAVKAAHYDVTNVIGEDTDLLVLLLFCANADIKDLYFRSDKPSCAKIAYHINSLQARLGKNTCCQLLFVHAFTGCDSTSRIFGVGKKAAFEKIINGHSVMISCADQFLIPNQERELIQKIGIQAMVVLFGGKGGESLTTTRSRILTKKIVSSNAFVAPERLPPTASSTKFHSFRVYFQIMAWMGKENEMNVMNWGWMSANNNLKPVMTDKFAVPTQLLQMIQCNCKTGCATNRCSCRVYGLPCTYACGQCQIDACENPFNFTIDDDEESQQ